MNWSTRLTTRSPSFRAWPATAKISRQRVLKELLLRPDSDPSAQHPVTRPRGRTGHTRVAATDVDPCGVAGGMRWEHGCGESGQAEVVRGSSHRACVTTTERTGRPHPVTAARALLGPGGHGAQGGPQLLSRCQLLADNAEQGKAPPRALLCPAVPEETPKALGVL